MIVLGAATLLARLAGRLGVTRRTFAVAREPHHCMRAFGRSTRIATADALPNFVAQPASADERVFGEATDRSARYAGFTDAVTVAGFQTAANSVVRKNHDALHGQLQTCSGM